MKGLLLEAGGRSRVAGGSVLMAFRQLGRDKSRSLLSLVGVSAGIFCITAARSVTESVSDTMRNGIDEFGGDALFVEQMPMEPDLTENGTFRWWKYVRRPEVSEREYLAVRDACPDGTSVTYSVNYNDGKIIAVEGDWNSLIRNEITSGRGFTGAELSHGDCIAIAGSDVKDVGKDSMISIAGVPVRVTGTFGRSGISSVGIGDTDNAVVIPYRLAARLHGLVSGRRVITVQPGRGTPESYIEEQVRLAMRGIRRLGAASEDNFSINRLSFIKEELNGLMKMTGTLGWIIGIFSLLVGGFGQANIMFVNIKERTAEIGLQKAVGAGIGSIALQYLTESAAIAFAGGLLGTGLTAAVCSVIPNHLIEISMSPATFAAGLAVALITGITAGLAPAISAANLQPAEALSGKN